MKINNDRKFNIITSIIYFIIILTYELFYCNFGFFQGINETYSISVFRILIYITFYIIYYIFKNKFIEASVESFENKLKCKIVGILLFLTTTILLIIIGAVTISKEYFLWETIAIIAILLFDLFIIYVTNDIVKNTILICITLGIIFSISITINNQLDEKKHFLSTYSLALGNFSWNNHTVDTSIAQIKRGQTIQDFNEYFNKYPENLFTNEYTSENLCETPATYYPISYIFSAVGIFLARILGGSIADIYFAGRIFNLFGYCFLMILILKILPYKKKIFYVVAFMPMLLCLSAIYSPDGIAFGLISIFIAYCLKLYNQETKVTIKQILILALTFVIMLISKSTGYIFTSLVIFILPIIKIFKDNKKNILYIILIILAIIGILMLLFISTYSSEIHNYGDTRSEGTNSSKQLEFIINNPCQYLNVLINHTLSIFGNMKCLAFLNAPMFFGGTYYNTFIIILTFILIIGLTDNSKSFNIKTRVIFILTFLAVFVTTSTALYLSYTKVGADYIDGYQMRYFFPIIPLFLMCISNKNIQYDKNRYKDILFITYIIGILTLISIEGVILKMI